MNNDLTNASQSQQTKTMTSTQFTRTVAVAGALLTGAVTAHAAPSSILDQEHQYLSVSAGLGLRDRPLSSRVSLSAGPVPIGLDGVTAADRARILSVTLGHQGLEKPKAPDSEIRHWRFEAQWWMASIKRKQFRAGVINVPLNDEVDVAGLYGHALTRVWRGENAAWWLGTGLGYTRVAIPDASPALPGCGCLSAVSGKGVSWRVLSTLERAVSESMSINGTLMYTSVPDARTAGNTLPSIETRIPRVLELQLGLRVAF